MAWSGIFLAIAHYYWKNRNERHIGFSRIGYFILLASLAIWPISYAYSNHVKSVLPDGADVRRILFSSNGDLLITTDRSGNGAEKWNILRVSTDKDVSDPFNLNRITDQYGLDPADFVMDRQGDTFIIGRTVVAKISPVGESSIFAGQNSLTGSVDGSGSGALFTQLGSMTIDAADNLFVTDGNLLRRISPSGMVTTVANFTSSGLDGGAMRATAALGRPALGVFMGLIVDSTGSVYCGDPLDHVLLKVSNEGRVTIYAGSPGQAGFVDGNGPTAKFTSPLAMAADKSGNIYVVDGYAVRKVTSDGNVTTLAGTPGKQGYVDGLGANALFTDIGAIAVDNMGNIVVSDTINATKTDGSWKYDIRIRRVSATGEVSTLFR